MSVDEREWSEKSPIQQHSEALIYHGLTGRVRSLAECYEHMARLHQARKANRTRGARSRPGLAGSVETLETALLTSYHRLPKQILESLYGPSDDVASGRIGQAKKKPKRSEEEALEEYGLPASAADDETDPERLAAILALIALWRRRHEAIADDAVRTSYDVGRARALAEQGRDQAEVTAETIGLMATVLARFQADLDRLQTGLTSGTARSRGIEEIAGSGTTLGKAAVALRELMNVEEFRIFMFAEALVWSAFLTGYRAGAVEGTLTAIAEGVAEEELMHYVWSGPEDKKACRPCLDRFGEPVIARSLAELPDPADVCEFRSFCRHWWDVAG